MKVKVRVRCSFEIEYEDDNNDMRLTVENIEMSSIQELIELETDDSIQHINVREIEVL
jgi:hypothetical protein